MTKEEAYNRMMEYKGKCDYCPLHYPECENTDCPTDEEILEIIMEVKNEV